VTKYVDVAVVGSRLKELVVLPVPLVEQLFDQIIVCIQPKVNRSFVGLSAGIAIYL
jgi:hypothetical protein